MPPDTSGKCINIVGSCSDMGTTNFNFWSIHVDLCFIIWVCLLCFKQVISLDSHVDHGVTLKAKKP